MKNDESKTNGKPEAWRLRLKRLRDEGVFDSPEFDRTYVHAVYGTSVGEWKAKQAREKAAKVEDDTLEVFLERMDRLTEMAKQGHPAIRRFFPDVGKPKSENAGQSVQSDGEKPCPEQSPKTD